jgi:hypothetical protein
LIDGRLFTRDFLLDGIRETAEWRDLNEIVIGKIRAGTSSLLTDMSVRKNPNEAQTEDDLVYPLLELVDWVFREVQPNASVKARLDVPDALLYRDAAAKALAGSLDPWQRFQHGLAIVEAKRWGRALDREERGRKGEEGTPSSQMLRYLRRIEGSTKGKLRWGILTNGRLWRLYYHGATSVAEDFLEIDLVRVFNINGVEEPGLFEKRPDLFLDDAAWREHVLKLFVIIFCRSAFLPSEQGETFHQLALREGKRWEEKVRDTLSEKVFGEVLPKLANALAARDPQRPTAVDSVYLNEVRQGALILLYRLLFVLYAEDRNLLPDESGPYAPYCLTKLRQEIAEKGLANYLPDITLLWGRLTTIFNAIAVGNDRLGIPPYNGGLFDKSAALILTRVQLHDETVAQVICGLSHEKDKGDGRGPRYINYRDLSVQQLGAVYESILEYGLRVREDGVVEIDADDDARHTSGSYYTPEELVGLIIDRAVGPLIEEKLTAFRVRATELKSDRRPVAERLAALEKLDPASAMLSLKVCDPAMGSGHFLVSLVDWMADVVLYAQEEAPKIVEWTDYVSPLAARVAAVREKILGEARKRNWPIVEAQLDDRHVVRRMVLKRVVYGVDKNPMAVELAKVALWLHSFTVGAPLSFLDHHLRAGDSVVGAWVRPTVEALQSRGSLFNLSQITRVELVAGLMAEIEETTDNDIAEVTSSKTKFGVVEEAIAPVSSLFSLLTAEQMIGVFDAEPKRPPKPIAQLIKLRVKEREIERARREWVALDRSTALSAVFKDAFGDQFEIAKGRAILLADDQQAIANEPHIISSAEGQSLDREEDLQLPKLEREVKRNSRTEIRRRFVAQQIVDQLYVLAHREQFFHWEIGFPNVWQHLASAEPIGGFDAVIGNPPYVRQELLGVEVKRALKASYASYSGMADLYIYFYEQGLKLLKPGGRLSYVVTNKWLRAGYAEELRGVFARKGWLEFIADFGHAKHFFPDADVFPSVVTVRKPLHGEEPPQDASVCVIPRDSVPRKGLVGAVEEATFPLPLAMFTKEAWVLEPKPEMDLLGKIRRNGVPLAEFAGVKPLSGIKTGLNEAFLINKAKRDELVRFDPACAEIIKPYLRGQDIQRWQSPDSGLFMILLKSSGNFAWPWANSADEKQAEMIFASTYPALHRHMKLYEKTGTDPKTKKATGLRFREDQGRFWWELRSCDYYEAFEQPKLIYQELTWWQTFQIEDRRTFLPNTAYMIGSTDAWLVTVLNSPAMWWRSWRRAVHGKDEALRFIQEFIIDVPIPPASENMEYVKRDTDRLASITSLRETVSATINDWLRHEFGLDKQTSVLAQPHKLNADEFAAAVRKALPKLRKLSAADIQRLKDEHHMTIEPAQLAAVEALTLERKLSDLVNTAYGLTPEDVKLMWETAPPRMPFTP